MKFKIFFAIAATLLLLAFLYPSIPFKGLGLIEWKLLNGQSTKLYSEKKYVKALLVAKHSLKVAEEKIGPESLRAAKSLNKLGEIYIHQKKYNQAEKNLKLALKIREEKLGPSHSVVATSLNNLGVLYHYKGKYNKAEKLHKKVLAMRKKSFGFYSSAVETSLHNLAETSKKLEKYKDALTFNLQSLDVYEKIKNLKILIWPLFYMISDGYTIAEETMKSCTERVIIKKRKSIT